VPRRVSLPSADDLFRPTEDNPGEVDRRGKPARSTKRGAVHAVPDRPEATDAGPAKGRRPSGRVRHDEKMTVYVTSGELVDIEHARLSLRSEHGLAVDRGRLVREAIAIVLADLEGKGADSALVRRLTEE
jgi:hypothetical protein